MENVKKTYSKRIEIAESIYKKYVAGNSNELADSVAEAMDNLNNLCDLCYDENIKYYDLTRNLSKIKLLLMNGYNKLLPILYATDKPAFKKVVEEINKIRGM